jgi:beta-lactamase regulating signal transducer with metallopeptidase domain
LEDLSAPAAGFAANSAARPVFAGLLSNWREMLVLLWACGSLICLVRMLFVRLRLRALIRRAVPVESIPISSRLRWLCRDLGIHREITVLASDEIDVPIAAGILDPKIILSRESAGWDETRRTAVLCHELAHIKRLDALTQLIAGFATAMYWFNPLVWFTVRAMRLERERACDDYVLAHGTPASDYAHELVEIVSSLRRPQPAAALAMARRSQLEGRVLALLNPSVRHGMLARGSALAVVAGVVSIALPLAAATLQERAPASTANSSASAAPLTKEATPSASKNVIEEDTSGETRGAIERGVESGIPGGIQSGMANGVQGGVEGGTQDGIREGVGAGYGRGSSDNGMPLYPGATVLEHSDGRGTVSLIRGAHVHQLQASSYLSRDNPQKVLQFYRDRLRNYGPVVECAGGTNPQVDFELDEASLRDPSVCRSSEFGAGGTEIKVDGSDDRRVVVTLPHEAGSEIALVRYQPAPGGPDSAWSQVQTSTSAPDAFHFGSGNGTGVGKGVNLSLQTSNSSPAPFDCFEGRHSEHSNISSHSENGNRTWTASWSDGECSIDAHSSGTVRFNADATAIESITPGGFFEVNERKGDTLRRLRVEPAANSQLSYTYKVNGAQQEFDSAARAWFSNFLLGLERVSGFAADSRVPALLKKGGPQAVLNEIAQLQSDYVRQVYFTKLFENATLPGPLLVKALDQAREDISTDYSLAQVLLTIAQKYDLNDEAQRTAFLNGANKLHTDYEHSRVLIELLKRPNLSPQILRAALESAKSIGTDYEKGRILTTLAGLSTFDEREINTYLDLASSIGTDYEHSRSLLALMEHQKLSSAAVSQILKSASTIGTDYEKSRILIATDGSSNFDEKQIATYLALVDSIGTDYERSRDLMALMHDHKLANDSLARIIAETQKIGTDYEKARVLTDVAERYQVQGALRDAYIKAADSIGTEYDRNRTLAAITKREMM